MCLERPEPLGQAAKPVRSRSNYSNGFKSSSTPERPIPPPTRGLPGSPVSSNDGDSIDSEFPCCLVFNVYMFFFNQGSACRLVLDFDHGHYPARSSTPDRTPTSSIPDLQNPVSSDDNDELLHWRLDFVNRECSK